MAPTEARCRRDGDALVFAGTLDRAAAVALWPQASRALDGARRLDVSAVGAVDSAGLALLAELASRCRRAGQALQVVGSPPGLSDLCGAYRLTPDLEFPAPGAVPPPTRVSTKEPA